MTSPAESPSPVEGQIRCLQTFPPCAPSSVPPASRPLAQFPSSPVSALHLSCPRCPSGLWLSPSNSFELTLNSKAFTSQVTLAENPDIIRETCFTSLCYPVLLRQEAFALASGQSIHWNLRGLSLSFLVSSIKYREPACMSNKICGPEEGEGADVCS